MDKDSSLHCWLGLRALPRKCCCWRLLLMMEAPRDEKGSFISLATRPPRQRPASRPVSDACKWMNAGECG